MMCGFTERYVDSVKLVLYTDSTSTSRVIQTTTATTTVDTTIHTDSTMVGLATSKGYMQNPSLHIDVLMG